MRPSIDPPVIAAPGITAESSALAKWYDANPAVQRLWGIREAQALRVVVSIAPTPDGDDVYPAWAANCRAWARELNLLTQSVVRLELVGESMLYGVEFDPEDVMVADLFWRDATLPAIEQSSNPAGLSADEILTVIDELHLCYDYCAAWKETTPDDTAIGADT
jgi:hypothetical protein